MTSRFLPFAFVELVSPYNKKNITRWLEDMNVMFSWQEQYLFASLTCEILFLPLEHNIHIFSPQCNFLYVFTTQFLTNSLKMKSVIYNCPIIFFYNTSEKSGILATVKNYTAYESSWQTIEKLTKSLNIMTYTWMHSTEVLPPFFEIQWIKISPKL